MGRDGTLRLFLQRRGASIELKRRGQRGVHDGGDTPPYEDRAVGGRRHVARFVDHVHVLGQRKPDAHETLLQVLEGQSLGVGVIGVDRVEQRIVRVGLQELCDVGGCEREVVLRDVTRRAGTAVRVREGLHEEPLARVRVVPAGTQGGHDER